MFPIALDLKLVKIALIGVGEISYNRLKQLDSLGASQVQVFGVSPSTEMLELAGARHNDYWPNADILHKFQVILVGDQCDKSLQVATIARDNNILVNVEDNREYCDFFFSSFFARGDLMLAVNTGGQSPALAIRIKNYLAQKFDASWAGKLSQIGAKRKQWKANGAGFGEVISLSNKYIDEQGWFDEHRAG